MMTARRRAKRVRTQTRRPVMLAVESAVFSHIGWLQHRVKGTGREWSHHNGNGILIVRYHSNDAIWAVAWVPYRKWRSFRLAQSKGKWWNVNIRGNEEYRQVKLEGVLREEIVRLCK